MDEPDYTSFNRKKDYRKNKTIQINHYHNNDRSFRDYNKLKTELKNAQELIRKYSLDKPIHSQDPLDRYTPMPKRSPSNDSTLNSPNLQDEDICDKCKSPLDLPMLNFIDYNTLSNKNIRKPTIIYPSNKSQETIKSTLPTKIVHIISHIPEDISEDTPEDIPKTNETVNPPEESTQEMVEILFTDPIINITDLIALSKKYPVEPNKTYSINLHKLHAIVPYLIELNEMVGIEDIKIGLTTQLMYFLQDFKYTHMLHTIIEGPPGVGKTCLGKILGKIYLELKCINATNEVIDEEEISSNINLPFNTFFSSMLQKKEKPKENKIKFKIAKRSDFVGQFVGHTAIKTQKLINECFGGVLFIDEAYSLGSDDPFSKECINTLNQNLSENGDKFICIIAGYADSLESNFFSFNSGLARRFPFRYTINKYTGIELTTILVNKIKKENYTLDDGCTKLLENYIETNKEYFPNFGGDIETYFFQIKMMHAKRVFGKSIQLRNIFTKDDLVNGLAEIKKNQKKPTVKLDMYT